MFNEQKNDLAVGLLCIFVIPALLFCGGYVVLAILGGMNTPAPRTVVNAHDEPLSVGETWQQGEAFELTVTDIRELAWSDPLLADVSAETKADYQEKVYRAFDVVFSMKNLGYQGYFYNGKMRPGLRVSVRAVGMDEEMSPTTILPDAGEDVFGKGKAAVGSSEGLGVGKSLADNHYIVFAEGALEHFEVIFCLTEDETLEELEARRKTGDTTIHAYEMVCRYTIPQAAD